MASKTSIPGNKFDDETVTRAVTAVEEHCGPDKLTKSAAVEFLEEVIDRLQSSIEALEEEIENEAGG